MFCRLLIISALLLKVVYQHPVPVVSITRTFGLAFNVKHKPGVSYISLKYIINNNNTTCNAVLNKQERDDSWVYTDENVKVKTGDEISYHLNVVIDGKQVTSRHKDILEVSKFPTVGLAKRVVRMVFKDDFHTWIPSLYIQEVSAWGGGNSEFQVYTPEATNTYTKNGILYLKPTFLVDNPHFTADQMYHGRMDLNSLYHACTQSANWGCDRTAVYDILNPVMSGKITTKAAIQYGRVNVRAKIPKGDWLWPAIWMLPRDWDYGGWPRSGEIDLMEAKGNTYAGSGGVNQGLNEIASTLHWGPDHGNNRFYKTHAEKRKSSGDWHDWHTYSLEWSANAIVTYVDDQEILRVNTPREGFWRWGGFGGSSIWPTDNAPFDKPLILNVAVGGAYFPDGWNYNSPKPWHGGGGHPMRDFWEKRGDWMGSWNGEEAAMQIDYIEMIQE